jgi:uncharacterized UPF0160 family protein
MKEGMKESGQARKKGFTACVQKPSDLVQNWMSRSVSMKGWTGSWRYTAQYTVNRLV